MAGVKGRSGRWRKLDEHMLADVRKLSLREGLRFLKDKSISPDKKAPYIFSVIGKLIPDKQEIRQVTLALTQDSIDKLVSQLEATLPDKYDDSSIISVQAAQNNSDDKDIIVPNPNANNNLQHP